MTKQCSKCKQVKPLGEFNRNRSMKYGRQHYCRPCQRTKDKENRGMKAAAQRRYALKRPDVIKAHTLARANKTKLQKGQCECCGTTKRLHMHHPDYSKPLEVVTLCNPCHKYTHVLIAAMAELAREGSN